MVSSPPLKRLGTGARFIFKNPTTTGEFIKWPGVAVESATMIENNIQIGMRDGWGQPVPFGISLPDLRQHIYVIGKTGSGKTTLLRNMIIQHIARGHGVGLIDPHGDLAEELLNHIPRWRTDHLVYFNPSDLEFPVALNLLANVPKDERHLVASGIVGAFKSIWPDSWGPRMEYILYNAIAALLDCQNTSLLGVNRMLTDGNYRAWVIRQIKDPFIKEFWEEEFAGYEERFRREAIAPIQNKLGQFLLNPVIRNILGQVKCKVSFPFIMDNQRLFIANLSKGKIGHDKANLLGSLLTTQFQLAAMRRASQPENERRDFYLFIDEFQNFTTDSFAAILAEARKYRLCLTLSHQYVDQIPQPIRQAVFGNVGTLFSFRIGNTDADVLQKEFANTFIAQQFVDLERFNVFSKILENGTNLQPFKGVTLQPVENRIGGAVAHVGNSRRRHAEPRKSVEERLKRLAGKNEPAEF
jgi:energy-coupling factor transporter ATP-binding protein EcfA2